jgi:hypothetical protein
MKTILVILAALGFILPSTPGAAQDALVLPVGTELSIRLEQSLSSATARVEDTILGAIERPVSVAGVLAIPAGTEVRGTVREVKTAERPRKSGKLQIAFDRLIVDGRRVDLDTRLVPIQDEDAGKETARKAGIAAIIGGAAGGLLKGRTGALIGVLAGGGIVAAQKGEDVELPEGTVLKAVTEREVAIRR